MTWFSFYEKICPENTLVDLRQLIDNKFIVFRGIRTSTAFLKIEFDKEGNTWQQYVFPHPTHFRFIQDKQEELC